MKVYLRNNSKNTDNTWPTHARRQRSTRAAARASLAPYQPVQSSRTQQIRSVSARIPEDAQDDQRLLSRLTAADEHNHRCPPLSQAQLVSVIKGIWHLSHCSECQQGNSEGCSLPICKSTRRLINKIASHTCPNACVGCSDKGLACKEIAGIRCRVCDLWGYIMYIYLRVHMHMRAASSLAENEWQSSGLA